MAGIFNLGHLLLLRVSCLQSNHQATDDLTFLAVSNHYIRAVFNRNFLELDISSFLLFRVDKIPEKHSDKSNSLVKEKILLQIHENKNPFKFCPII